MFCQAKNDSNWQRKRAWMAATATYAMARHEKEQRVTSIDGNRGRPALPWKYLVPLLIFAGILVRYAWILSHGQWGHAGGEAENVAISLARDGVFGDTFARGSGASAHFTPSMALITGGIYALFGVQTGPAEAVLSVFSIGLSLAGAWIWYRIFEELGAPRASTLLALAAFCLLPMNVSLEAESFRVWEGALAVFLAGLSLLQAVRLDKQERPSLGHLAVLVFLCALTFYVNPAIGLAAYGAFGLLLLRRVPIRRWPAAIGLAFMFLVLVLTPWTLRNLSAFDRFIPLRSNFGIELALANHPAALSDKDEHQVFLDRLREIHPLESPSAFARMQATGGEIPFAQQLGTEAKSWIAAHPEGFAELSARHWFEYYFPPLWLWDIYNSNRTQAATLRQAITWGLSLLALIAAAWMPLSRGSRYLYVSLFMLMPSLPYAIVQPVPRYRYLVYAPMLFAATWLAYAALRWLLRTAGRPEPETANGRATP
jgi:hypothetical protein